MLAGNFRAMLTPEKWKRLSLPYLIERFNLFEKAGDNGLTEEEKKRYEYLDKVLDRLFHRFLKHYPSRKK